MSCPTLISTAKAGNGCVDGQVTASKKHVYPDLIDELFGTTAQASSSKVDVDDLFATIDGQTTPSPPPSPPPLPQALQSLKKTRTQKDAGLTSTDSSACSPRTARPSQRQRTCAPSIATRVYLTTPTRPNESMKVFAERAGYSVHVLRTYNPQYDVNALLPPNTCFLTWEHSCHTASCFELSVEGGQPLQHDIAFSQLLCQHATGLYQSIGNDCRISNDCEFVPTYAQGLSASLPHQQTVTLTATRTFTELTKEDKDLRIDWDFIAKNAQQYPAVFRNTRNTEYTFFFEKFLQNGNCKGVQSLDTLERKHSYLNSAGLSLDKLFYRAGAQLPTRVQGKQHCIASCEEKDVEKDVATMHPLTLSADSRALYTEQCTQVTTHGNGFIYTNDSVTQTTSEVGVWTKQNGWMCCTLFGTLHRVIVKKM